MSDIKNKDRILDAIDQLRRRKARPDVDRICNFLLRRFAVDSKETIADLQRLVDANIVVKVEYKGNTSYRNAAKWSKFAMYKNRGIVETNVGIEARSALSRAFASLLVEDPDYLDFGIPGNELIKFLLEDDLCADWTEAESTLQREINSGYLVKLGNGNYSLADIPVPNNTPENNFTNCTLIKIKPEMASSSNVSDREESPVEKLQIQNKPSKPTVINIRKPEKNEKNNNLKDCTNERFPTSSVNVSGYRVGVRRKRAKKVFDPSDNNIPTRKRGRPLGSTNKNKEASHTKVELQSSTCVICHQGYSKGSRGQFDRLLTCRDCSNKAHGNCVEGGDKTFWLCPSCKMCAICSGNSSKENLMTCSSCNENYHSTCHIPHIPEKAFTGKWVCASCILPKHRTGVVHNVSGTITVATVQETWLAEDTKVNCQLNASLMSVDEDDTIDDTIPDISGWNVEKLFRYLCDQGYPEQATVFKENLIDGPSLLLMKRSDVIQGLQMKLGPALKIYSQVKKLQLRQSDPHIIWS